MNTTTISRLKSVEVKEEVKIPSFFKDRITSRHIGIVGEDDCITFFNSEFGSSIYMGPIGGTNSDITFYSEISEFEFYSALDKCLLYQTNFYKKRYRT